MPAREFSWQKRIQASFSKLLGWIDRTFPSILIDFNDSFRKSCSLRVCKSSHTRGSSVPSAALENPRVREKRKKTGKLKKKLSLLPSTDLAVAAIVPWAAAVAGSSRRACAPSPRTFPRRGPCATRTRRPAVPGLPRSAFCQRPAARVARCSPRWRCLRCNQYHHQTTVNYACTYGASGGKVLVPLVCAGESERKRNKERRRETAVVDRPRTRLFACEQEFPVAVPASGMG